MAASLLINILITVCCFIGMGYYFNYREKKLHNLAEKKLLNFKDQYLHNIANRKVKEKSEIDKLKTIARKLEEKHKQILESEKKNAHITKDYEAEVTKIIKQAEERARLIEEGVKEDAHKFLEEQKKEVQTKMVDLVLGVTRKVMSRGLTYSEHKRLIEEALAEMEGEDED